MFPSVWHCHATPLVDVLGLLLNPLCLVTLAGFWGLAGVLGRIRYQRLVGWLVFPLTVQAVSVWILCLLAGVILQNPTAPIHIVEALGIAASLSTLGATLVRYTKEERWSVEAFAAEDPNASVALPYRDFRRARAVAGEQSFLSLPLMVWKDGRSVSVRVGVWSAGALAVAGAVLLGTVVWHGQSADPSHFGLFFAPSIAVLTPITLVIAQRKLMVAQHKLKRAVLDRGTKGSRAHTLVERLAVAIAACCIGVYLAATAVPEGSPWSIPRTVLRMLWVSKTTAWATDQCLLRRITEPRPARNEGYPTGRQAELGRALGAGFAAAPGRAAERELIARGDSAWLAMETALGEALKGADQDRQARLFNVLRYVTRWAVADAMVDQWATATPPAYRQETVTAWVVCRRKGERSRVYLRIDAQCEEEKPRTAASP